MSNGYEAKILTPYIPALKDVVLRLYLIEKQSADYGALMLTIEFCIENYRYSTISN